tara:strand:- start:29 stop:301 length:273 start_codon:yes stop_codon:yes gene_type:complete
MGKIYIVATTYQDTNLEMSQCYTSEDACNSIFYFASEDCPDFREPNPTDDPQDYLSEYVDYLYDEGCDKTFPDYHISLQIIDQKEEVASA